MLHREWQPAYEAILTAFGYDAAGDVAARDVLFGLVTDAAPLKSDSIDLPGTVAVCGGGPSLAADLDRARRADTVVAASTAADVCRDAGVAVDCMVTDLDKNPETAVELAAAGTPVAVHAHGDNVDLIEAYVPAIDVGSVLPTTQAAPRPPVVNPGGFTDGDRAAFLADACGADRLVFPGWDFDDTAVSAAKAEKLRWAARLLRWLELRRNEEFGVLDGRRGDIRLPWLA